MLKTFDEMTIEELADYADRCRVDGNRMSYQIAVHHIIRKQRAMEACYVGDQGNNCGSAY